MRAGKVPVRTEFVGVPIAPFSHESQCATRQTALQDFAGLDGDHDLVLSVLRAKVRRRVFAEIPADEGSVEAADRRPEPSMATLADTPV